MNRAIFLYNDGTMLPNCFSNNLQNNGKNEDNLLFRLMELQLYGYKIIQLVCNPDYYDEIQECKIRIIDFGTNSHSKKLSLVIRELFVPKNQEHDIDCTMDLIIQASDILELELSKSWIIGNTLNDIDAGNRMGMHTIIVDNGEEDEWFFGPGRSPNYFVKDLNSAINDIKMQSIVLT